MRIFNQTENAIRLLSENFGYFLTQRELFGFTSQSNSLPILWSQLDQIADQIDLIISYNPKSTDHSRSLVQLLAQPGSPILGVYAGYPKERSGIVGSVDEVEALEMLGDAEYDRYIFQLGSDGQKIDWVLVSTFENFVLGMVSGTHRQISEARGYCEQNGSSVFDYSKLVLPRSPRDLDILFRTS